MEIRTLTEDDAAEYQAVRLRSLQEHPEAPSEHSWRGI